MSKDQRKFRMTLPKNEDDYQRIEEEIHGSGGIEHGTHHHHEHEELETPEDMQLLLLNAIAHTLGHMEASLNNLSTTVKSLSNDLRDLKLALNSVVKVLLLSEIQNPETKKELLADVLKKLIEE